MKTRINNLLKDDLLRHTIILFAGMMVVNVSNLAFQMLVSRRLPDVEYALLAAFLSVLGILSYPLLTLSTGLGHYCSLLRQQQRGGDIRRLVKKWLFLTGIPALVLGGLVIIFNYPVAQFLHLDRAAPVIILGAVLPALFWSPVLNGAAQGLELFGWNTASAILGALLKLVMGAGLVWFWYPACGWAMIGHSAGIYLSVAVLLIGLVFFLRGASRTQASLPSLRMYLGQSFLVQIAFAILMNADVIIVKHFLPADTDFPYAGTLGRIVVFLPGAIAIAMFPKVATAGAGTVDHRRIFLRSFGYTALCVAAAALACMLFPSFVLHFMFGIREANEHLIYLSRLMCIAMTACALLNVTIQFLLAQRRFGGLWIAVIACILYLVSARMYHATSEHIALAAIGANLLALTGTLFAALYVKSNRATLASA